MIKAEKSEFSFVDFKINGCYFDFSKDKGVEINVNFRPYGKYFKKTNIFKLFLEIKITTEDNVELVKVNTESTFKFKEECKGDLYNYFIVNAPAISFPYVRSFIASLTAQSGHKTLLIPTLNLMKLADELKSNIKIIEEELEEE